MSWAWTVTNRQGTTTGFVAPRRVVIDRRLNAPTTVQVTADAAQAQGLVHGRLVKGYRTPDAGGPRVLRTHGQVAQVQTIGNNDALEQATAEVADGLWMLGHRFTYTPWSYTAQTPRAIIEDQISITDAIEPVGLYIATSGASGPPRDRNYESAKNIAEIVSQLSAVDDGFWFRVDPYEGTGPDGLTTLFSELVLLYPASGTERNIAFEYGPGGIGNIHSIQTNVMPPVNYVNAYGAGDAGSQIISFKINTASVDAYGLYQVTLNLTDVSEQATLDQHALDALRPEPQVTYTCIPVRFGDNLPTPWEDFDVGDTVMLRLRGEAPYLRDQQRVRVTGFQLTIDADGVESLTGLSLEAV